MGPFIMLMEQIYSEYKNYIAPIHRLDYAWDDDKRKAAVIKHFAQKLGEAAEVVAAYGTAEAAEYCARFYARVNAEIYSVPANKFGDMYKAEDIRRQIVESFQHIDEMHRAQAGDFLAGILINEPSYFVRWEAVDVLRKWPLRYS
jgi:hypothetical protein